jgi:hypothetical protein
MPPEKVETVIELPPVTPTKMPPPPDSLVLNRLNYGKRTVNELL